MVQKNIMSFKSLELVKLSTLIFYLSQGYKWKISLKISSKKMENENESETIKEQ
jgi:hypothetical protein